MSRGLVLLGIAIANVTVAWLMFGGGPAGPFGAVPQNTADVVVGVFNAMFVHQRGLPMFSALLTYGLGLLLTRDARRGTPFGQARGRLLKRYLMLAAIGAVHMVFIFVGDVLVAYGLIASMIALLFLRTSDKTLLRLAIIIYAVVAAGVLALFAGELWLRASYPEALTMINDAITNDSAFSLVESSYPMKLLTGLLALFGTALGGFLFQGITFAPVMLIGFVAGRRWLLNDPDQHLRLLRIIGYGGIAVSILGGLPVGLMTMGVLGEQPWLMSPIGLSLITGLPGGLATIALITLACRRWQPRAGGPTRPIPLPVQMLQALGARSLSGYLFQSVVFFALLPPVTLGLAGRLGIATGSLLAAGVWFVSLIGAWLLARAGKRGPAETLHRWMINGRRSAVSAGSPRH
ncbi:DUF418 domain-containing protein [Enemella sp. A6]|uniref:DUF418 domain-containing protein n=1 Tax=Enemella sp. A6 TaxID=3440152 RepID=UPI003EC0DA34